MEVLHDILIHHRHYTEDTKQAVTWEVKGKKNRKIPMTTRVYRSRQGRLYHVVALPPTHAMNKDMYRTIRERYPTETLLVLCRSYTSSAWRRTQELQCFTYEEVKFNLFHHVLVPDYEVVDELPQGVIKSQLPKMLYHDPVAHALGLQPEQVLMIHSRSSQVGMVRSMRVVAPC